MDINFSWGRRPPKRLDSWTEQELRSVIRFLWARNVSLEDMKTQLENVYGPGVTSMEELDSWCKEFMNRQSRLGQERRMGRPATSASKENVERTLAFIEKDPRMSVKDISEKLGLKKGSVYNILHNILGYRKVGEEWVQVACAKEEAQNASKEESLEGYLEEVENDNINYIVHEHDIRNGHFLDQLSYLPQRAFYEEQNFGMDPRKRMF